MPSPEWAKAWKYLISPPALDVVNLIAGRARKYHYEKAVPFGENGIRLLASEMVMEYIQCLNAMKDEYCVAVEQFCSQYDRLSTEAKEHLHGLWSPTDYPTNIRDKFNFAVKVRPIPSSDHFLVDLESDEIARIKKEMETEINDQINEAVNDLWIRAKKVIAHAEKRLKDSDGLLYDSVIGNVKMLTQTLPRLNVMGDNRVTELCEEIEKTFSKVQTEDLRVDKAKRKEAATKCSKMMDRLAAYANRNP